MGVDGKICSKISDPSGRFIILKVIIEENVYILVNIYAPNKDKEIIKFLDDLITVTRKENLDEEENFIVGGDFNCPFNPTLDKKGGLLVPRKSVVASIECFQAELDLADIWRIKNPTLKSFIWNQSGDSHDIL